MPLHFWLCCYKAYFLCPHISGNDLYASVNATVASLLFILEGWVSWDDAIVGAQVNWGNCGIPWVNCQFSVWKTTGKDNSEACAIAFRNCAVYSVFPSGMMSHSKIAQFNWECIAPFTEQRSYSLVTVEESLNIADGVKKLLRSVDTYPSNYVTSYPGRK